MGHDDMELKERGHWQGKLDFILSLIGFSVGLGNVWRFPYLCYKNGGGAFLIPYFICLVVAGIPLLMLELALGQFMSQGGITSWNIIPGWKGIGIASIVIVNWLNYYYNIILAWDLYYMGLSFQSRLPWSHCNNTFNTENCLDPDWIYKNNNETQPFACGVLPVENATTKNLKQVCLNGVLRSLSEFTPASEEFFERNILQQNRSDGLHNMGGVNWQLAICLIVAWITIYLIICKGVKSSGKVVYFTALFPYVLLTILLVRAVTLENAIEGLTFYLKPDLSRLNDGKVWLDAATQIFFSYSIGLGTMQALTSYSRYHSNFFRDGLIFVCFNSGTSIYAGVVIFAVLGFMAGQQGVAVQDVANGGPGLAFVAYPEAVTQMPIPQLWAVLFFFMILLLGIDSEFVGVEGFVTAVVDTWPRFFMRGYRREIFAFFYCAFSCCVGISMTCYGGIYVFQLFDSYAASGSALLWIAMFESSAIAYFYGGGRFLTDMNSMLQFREGGCNFLWKIWEWYLLVCWYALTPLFALAVFIFSFVGYENISYQGYQYPWWGVVIGWGMALSSMLTPFLYFIYSFMTADGDLSERWHALLTPRIPQRDGDGEVLMNMHTMGDKMDNGNVI